MFNLLRRSQLLPILVGIMACQSVQSLNVPEPNSQLEGNPRVVRVMRQDRSVFTIYRPTVKGDSLVGWLDKPVPDTSNAQRVALNLLDIREISLQKVDPTATAGWFFAGALAFLALFVIVIISSIGAEGS